VKISISVLSQRKEYNFTNKNKKKTLTNCEYSLGLMPKSFLEATNLSFNMEVIFCSK